MTDPGYFATQGKDTPSRLKHHVLSVNNFSQSGKLTPVTEIQANFISLILAVAYPAMARIGETWNV